MKPNANHVSIHPPLHSRGILKIDIKAKKMNFDRLVIGCGYLGLRAAKRWAATGMKVAATTRSEQRAADFKSLGITPIVADVTDARSLATLPTADCVLHAVGFDRSAGPSKRDVYVDGLANALAAVSDKADKLVHISSTSVYGQSDGELVNESSPCEPTSEGGQICLEAERLVRANSTSWNILRLAGIYGPGRLLRRVEQVQSAEPIAGRPDAYLNLIHVEDAVSAIDACLKNWQHERVVLVADGNTTTRQEYFETLSRVLGGPQPSFDPNALARHSTGLNKRCDVRQLLASHGMQLAFSVLADGIRDSVETDS